MFRSIRWRLVFSYVFLVLLILSLVGAMILQLVQDYVEQQEREYLTANAQAVARQAHALMWPLIQQRELQNLSQTSAFLGKARVRILDSHERVLADSWSPAGEGGVVLVLPRSQRWIESMLQVPSGSPLPVTADGEWIFRLISQEGLESLEHYGPEGAVTVVRTWDDVWGTRFSYEVIEGPAQLDQVRAVSPALNSEHLITVPVGEADEPLGYVQISHGTDYRTEVLGTIRRAFLFAAGGGLLLAVIVGLLVSRQLVAPLRDLAAVAGQMSSGDLSARASVRGKDEIGQLARQFNQMVERLEASFTDLAAERDVLRRFMADASHELRTPITALRSFNDLLQGAASDDPGARVEFLAESQMQLDRLEWVTRNLLDLSRLDAGLADLEMADQDVGEILDVVAGAFRGLAQERGIELVLETPSPAVTIRCDRARIEMALSNLMNNAFKFTPAGGRVELGARQEGEIVALRVRDNGSGIAPEDLPHIFERFYRGRDSHGEGSGLGLAIVQSIAQGHGGQVSAESETGVGSLFVIELPRGA